MPTAGHNNVHLPVHPINRIPYPSHASAKRGPVTFNSRVLSVEEHGQSDGSVVRNPDRGPACLRDIPALLF